MAFGPENLGVPYDEMHKRVEDALKAVGMTEYAKHSPARLSGGQKQRVAIAGVIAMLPECIILDESTAMLDPRGRREVLDVVVSPYAASYMNTIYAPVPLLTVIVLLPFASIISVNPVASTGISSVHPV